MDTSPVFHAIMHVIALCMIGTQSERERANSERPYLDQNNAAPHTSRQALLYMYENDPNKDRHLIPARRVTDIDKSGELGYLFSGPICADGAGGKRACNRFITGRSAFNAIAVGEEGTSIKLKIVGLQGFCNRCSVCEQILAGELLFSF